MGRKKVPEESKTSETLEVGSVQRGRKCSTVVGAERGDHSFAVASRPGHD